MKRSLRSWLWRVPVVREVDEEIDFHLEMRTRELVERGMDPNTAREVAMRRLGDLSHLKRTCVDLGIRRDRTMRRMQWVQEFRQDVSFALRQLKSAPAFTSVAVLTLALGIGANSAMFALVDATLLRPLPFREPDRLVMAWERSASSMRSRVAPLNLLDWTERNQTFEAMGAFVPNVGGMVMSGADGLAETVPRQWATSGIFTALGVRPVAGRTFLPSDDAQRARVVVFSEAFWRSRFNADPTVIGRDIRFDGALYTVIGVVPNEAQLIGRSAMWALTSFPRRPGLRTAYALQVIGRLKPGVTLERARADLDGVAAGLAREFPDTNKGRGITLAPLHEAMIGNELRLTSLLFLGVVGFVLLICCANVANLLLARATVRTRELAMRTALGAGRGRLIRQLLTESLVLAAIGGLLGVGVGAAILDVAPAAIPVGLLPGAVTLSFDGRVVAFCAAAAVFVGLLFGLAPAWQATGFSTAQVIASDNRAATGRGGLVRGILVTVQIATAVLLLFGAGLLLRTLLAVEHVDRGYRAESILTMVVDPLGARYPTETALLQFFDAVQQEVTALPAVRSVAWASTLPMGPSYAGDSFFEIVGDPPLNESQRPAADYQIVNPTYFRTLDLPLVAGRGFSDGDTRDTVPVCIVNEALVRSHIHGRSPIGVRLALRSTPTAKPVVREIVGVARQVKGRPDELSELLQIYVPMAQDAMDDMFLVVRPSSGSAAALTPSVRAAIGRIDKEQLVSVREVMTLDDIASDATSRHRFRAVMVVTFAVLALLLAMVGVFGILSYSVQQRVREFGVRRALGATSNDVLGLVVSSAARLVASGVAIGLVVAAMLAGVLRRVLFGVAPLDPITFAAVTAVLIITAAVSIAGPAWRATHIDPAKALRGE
ncbi:MAG: ABC transporter permease [Vicinamibacterales bacterium]